MTKSKRNILIISVSILLVAVIAMAISLGVLLPQQTVYVAKVEDELPNMSNDVDGSIIDITPTDEYGIALTSVAVPAADGNLTRTLTATVTSSSGSVTLDKTVLWEVAWKNPASAWATGKTVTDYLTCVPTEDGATTATVTCLQGFSEQIDIKCVSAADDSKYAICTVDYVKRVADIKLSMNSNDSDYKLNMTDGTNIYNFQIDEIIYSDVGTKTVAAEISHLSFEYDSLFGSALNFQASAKAGGFTATKGVFSPLKSNLLTQHDCSFSMSIVFPQSLNEFNSLSKTSLTSEVDLGLYSVKFDSLSLGSSYSSAFISIMSAFKKNLTSKLQASDKAFTLHFSYKQTIGDDQELTAHIQKDVYVGNTNFPSIAVSSVTLDNSALAF